MIPIINDPIEVEKVSIYNQLRAGEPSAQRGAAQEYDGGQESTFSRVL